MNDSFKGLMAAVITRAMDDLKDPRLEVISPRKKDSAMAFILGPDCEAYCIALEMDYRTIREKAVILYRQFLENDPAIPKPIQRHFMKKTA
jgi:hypothetical protein